MASILRDTIGKSAREWITALTFYIGHTLANFVLQSYLCFPLQTDAFRVQPTRDLQVAESMEESGRIIFTSS